MRFRSSLILGALLCASGAHADVITFSNVDTSGGNGNFPTYVEGAYTVTDSADALAFNGLGDPPNAVGSDFGLGTITVRRIDASQFTFSSADIAFSGYAGPGAYFTITGSLGGQTLFQQNGGYNAAFTTYSYGISPAIDTLRFDLYNPYNLVILDNVAVSSESVAATPEPGTLALMTTGFAMFGLFGLSHRRVE